MEKYNLITSGLREVIGTDRLKRIIEKRNIRVYFGTACTGKPHIGYLISFIKIAHLLKAGCEVKILFADVHAMLDSLKTTDKLLDHRTLYYQQLIKGVLKTLKIDISKLTFIKGSSFQLNSDYILDLYKLISVTSVNRCIKAGSEVVKQSFITADEISNKIECNNKKEIIDKTIDLYNTGRNPSVGSVIYPCLQALDEIYLDVDAELSGSDQRSVYTFSLEEMKKIGYKRKGIYLMTEMLPSFSKRPKNGKMSSSDTEKITFLEEPEIVEKIINSTFCEEKNMSTPLIKFIELVIIPLLELNNWNNFDPSIKREI